MTDCPCGSGKSYSLCCEPVINTQSATTALQLMRSRYTAYCITDAAYLYNTTHPKTRKAYKMSEIEAWSKENKWAKLEVIHTHAGLPADDKGTVEFKAYFTDAAGKAQVHHEKSAFVKENKQWFYADGVANPRATVSTEKVQRNAPCPCGSGKKYKKCCA